MDAVNATIRTVSAGAALALAGSACVAQPDIPRFGQLDEMRLLARAEGQLAYDREGCLVLDNGDVEQMLLAWPTQAIWDPHSHAITMDGTTAAVGDKVILGGGEGLSPPREDWPVPPQPACWKERRWVVHGLRLMP
jgi:hypothetical protein